MAMNIPNNLSTTVVSQAQSPPLPPPGGSNGDRPPHVTAIEKLGGALAEDIKNALFAGAEELEDSGASLDEIQAFVDSELETSEVDSSAEQPRTGQLVDMMI